MQDQTDDEKVMYIYTTDHFIKIANKVNNGDDLYGYKIHLMSCLNSLYKPFDETIGHNYGIISKCRLNYINERIDFS